MTRNRSRNTGSVDGSLVRLDGNSGLPWQSDSYNGTTNVETMIDNPPGKGRPFDLYRKSVSGGLVNGDYVPEGGGETRRANNFLPLGFRPYAMNTNHLSIDGSPSNGVAAGIAAKKTNPSQPSVDLPAFMAELREIPELIHSLGNSAIKKIAGTNLNYQYGIAPLVGDLVKLTEFATVVEERLKELRKRRLGPSWKTSKVFSGSNTLIGLDSWAQSYIMVMSYTEQVTTLERVWAQTLWVPDSVPSQTSKEALTEAIRVAYGLNQLSFATAWELFPWSWAADWCASIGDYLQANRNSCGISLGGVNVMRHVKTTRDFTPSPGAPGILTKATTTYETKSRTPASPTIEAHEPVLSLRQMSIIGSISVLRGR